MAARVGTAIVWFRRDLRLSDHVALAHAGRDAERVVCAFVLDPVLLRSPRTGAPLVTFFFDSLADLREALRARGSDLVILEGDAAEELAGLVVRAGATALYFNRDVDPAACERDDRVRAALRARGTIVSSFIDHVYYGAGEVLQAGDKPYVMFAPYKRRWLERHGSDPRPPLDSARLIEGKLAPRATTGASRALPAPEEFGHDRSAFYPRGGEAIGAALLRRFVGERAPAYDVTRNIPAADGTSQLSPHLRAGTIGIRACVWALLQAREADGARATGYDAWLSELIWRDFYQQILGNFPHVATQPFLSAANGLPWRTSQRDFAAWSEGRTGYPIVDAAMAQLKTTGWMHNRLRMIVASFLSKDLLLDYRLGERHFERGLADADLAANNGGWQWSASTGTDAAPYFRIFNPVTQSRTFDPQGDFIRAQLPQLARLDASSIHEPWRLSPLQSSALGFEIGRDYPRPIVDHAEARRRALAFFAPVLGRRVVKT